MQGLITLDFGNTNPHAGIFLKKAQSWELAQVVPFTELGSHLGQYGLSAHNSHLVVCEVKAREEELAFYQQQGYLLTRLKDYWRGKKFAGMPVHYAQTLGEDRLINAYFLYKRALNPTLLIDAGTYTTLDLITEAGLAGGYIVPGQRSYLEAFKQGEQLKQVHITPQLGDELPQTTPDAMGRSYRAFLTLAIELIKRHNIQNVVLTGGEHRSWVDALINTQGIVVEARPHLLHSALHFWMTTQIEPL
jgi:type III pantothenate kinase